MVNTITVERGNTVLDIMPEEKTKYLAKGFNVIDSKGRIIERGELVDIKEVRKAYGNLKARCDNLEDENAKLKSEIAGLKKKLKASKS